MASIYQIVFSGKILDGFDPDDVKRAAALRLKASPEMADQIFSGKRVIFKKGLVASDAQQYHDTLAKLGMSVEVLGAEQENAGIETPVPASSAFDPQRIASNLAHAHALLNQIGSLPMSA